MKHGSVDLTPSLSVAGDVPFPGRHSRFEAGVLDEVLRSPRMSGGCEEHTRDQAAEKHRVFHHITPEENVEKYSFQGCEVKDESDDARKGAA